MRQLNIHIHVYCSFLKIFPPNLTLPIKPTSSDLVSKTFPFAVMTSLSIAICLVLVLSLHRVSSNKLFCDFRCYKKILLLYFKKKILSNQWFSWRRTISYGERTFRINSIVIHSKTVSGEIKLYHDERRLILARKKSYFVYLFGPFCFNYIFYSNPRVERRAN